ncbi:MAG: folate-binding protein YgfZ [Gammaproteobacteria bacterium]|nr:folate-binding protein YgfZ [Gammaproteobacteria bacterium]
MNESTQSIHAALLPFLGVLRIGGPDAARFLQGQLTNDVRLLTDGRTQLAAYNTPQGRVIALLRLHQTDDAIHALLPAELLDRVSSLLRRFVLRSKVELQVAADLQVGWIGTAALSGAIDPAAYDATRTMSAIPVTAATHVVAFDYAPGRQVVAVPPDAWRSMTGLSSSRARPGIQHEWLAADIADGLPQVFAATSEQFVAQMLNLDLLDAISFTKGCYTGQEIVARTQNLGRIKRRTFRYHLDGGPQPLPMAGLYRDGTKVAEVVMSAPVGGGVHLLAVANLDARDRPLTLDDGRIATPVNLPYDVPV